MEIKADEFITREAEASIIALARELQGVPLVITGGSGFVGLSLLLALDRAEVSCLVLDLGLAQK